MTWPPTSSLGENAAGDAPVSGRADSEPNGDHPSAAATAALIPLAQAQLAEQLGQAETSANRALTEIGLVVALVAVLCGARLAAPSIPFGWWVPILGLLAAAGCLSMCLRPVELDTGRTPEAAYELVRGLDDQDAFRKILAMLQEALEANAPLVGEKSHWLVRGQWLLGGTVVVGPLVLAVWTRVH